jgi:hypothetical protein
MIITEVTPQQYGAVLTQVPHPFNTVAFNELNARKCAALHHLLFTDRKVRGGIILGETDGKLISPFSAPFGGFTFTRNQRANYVDDMVSALVGYAQSCGKSLTVTLPPPIYNESMTAKCVSAFTRIPCVVTTVDLSYNLPVDATPTSSGRRALRRAESIPFIIKRLPSTPPCIARVYEVIKANHIHRNHPLHMSLTDVITTVNLISADFFILSLGDTDLAAAMLYRSAPGIAQLIYWGDTPGHSQMRVMNRLAAYLQQFYAGIGIHTIDLGTASVNGTPDYQLCAFKESIGAVATPRHTFTIQ